MDQSDKGSDELHKETLALGEAWRATNDSTSGFTRLGASSYTHTHIH